MSSGKEDRQVFLMLLVLEPKSSMYRTLLLCVHEFRLMENFIFARSEDPVHDGGNCQVECQTEQVMFYRRKYLPMSTRCEQHALSSR